jgi:two-component system response regulator AtoC
MRGIAVMVDRVADNDVTVLIRGESGVGKELVARAIHDRSVRRARPFVKVNCAALPDDLLESELFGHEKGAFTGATVMRPGKFEHADGGTLMLDEIGEMKAGLQAKLLHVLQDGEFSRLGGNKRVTVDVRIVAATNRDLEAMLERSEFREDLYYRLKVIEIIVPPLRQRHDEIPELIEFFVGKYSKRYNRPMPSLAPALLEALQNYGWPGNIRELENIIKRFVILQDEALLLRDLRSTGSPVAAPTAPVHEHGMPPGAAAVAAVASAVAPDGTAPQPESRTTPTSATCTLAEVARLAIVKAELDLIVPTLRRVNWNRKKAAPLLGVSYKTLLNKIKEHGIVQG